LGELAVCGAVARERKGFQRNGAQKSPGKPPRSGGEKMDALKANQLVEITLNGANDDLCQRFGADILIFKSPIRQPLDSVIKVAVEEMKSNSGAIQPKLVVMVETTGGYIETVECIVSVFRNHYAEVEFVVPNYAYSAGTILVLSGDEIHMDYYSILGPIDPQIENEDGDLVPGMAYLYKFEETVKKINTSGASKDVRAELSYLNNKFDPGTLFSIEQSIEHAKALLREWLPKYKFKKWNKRETSGRPVSALDKRRRADKIANILGNAKHWHSHGRGIGIRELTGEHINLKVNDFSKDRELYNRIAHYHGLFTDFMGRRGMGSALHTKHGMRRIQ
jgi:hypothetical protein